MRITEAAQRLGTSPRMLRYRDTLGLLPPVREAGPARQRAGAAPARRRAGIPQDRSRAGAPRDQGHAGTARDQGHAGTARDLGRAAAPRDQGHAGAPRDQGHAGTARDLGRAAAPRDQGQAGMAPAQGQAGTAPAEGRALGGRPRGHRRFADDDLAAVAHALRIEQRYDISPAALAFGLKVLTEPGVRAEVAELGRRIGKIAPPPARALDFEQQRAQRLLRLPPGGAPRARRD